MTRQERLGRLAGLCEAAQAFGEDVAAYVTQPQQWEADAVEATRSAFGAASDALDHLAALEQAAIDAYLSNVPLPEGWRESTYEDRGAPGAAYFDESGNERVWVQCKAVTIWPKPAHWPPIPLPVLLRAAVQCHRLREAGR